MLTFFIFALKFKEMKAYVFPGQGAQFTGMGKDLYDNSPIAKEMFLKANEILGFDITKIMFEGTPEELSAMEQSVLSSMFPELAIHIKAQQMSHYSSGSTSRGL